MATKKNSCPGAMYLLLPVAALTLLAFAIVSCNDPDKATTNPESTVSVNSAKVFPCQPWITWKFEVHDGTTPDQINQGRADAENAIKAWVNTYVRNLDGSPCPPKISWTEDGKKHGVTVCLECENPKMRVDTVARPPACPKPPPSITDRATVTDEVTLPVGTYACRRD